MVVFVTVSTTADVLSPLRTGGAARVIATSLADLRGVSSCLYPFLSHAEVIFRTLTCLAKVEQTTLILLVGEFVVVAHIND